LEPLARPGRCGNRDVRERDERFFHALSLPHTSRAGYKRTPAGQRVGHCPYTCGRPVVPFVYPG
jgi:hypothetical protein